MDDDENEVDGENLDSNDIQAGVEKKKKERKTKAMVINHHIYF